MLSTAMLHVTRQAICMMMQMIEDCWWNDGAVMALLAITAHWVWFAFAHYFCVCFESAVPAFAYVLDGSFGTWNDIFRDFRNHGCCFCNLSAKSRVFVEIYKLCGGCDFDERDDKYNDYFDNVLEDGNEDKEWCAIIILLLLLLIMMVIKALMILTLMTMESWIHKQCFMISFAFFVLVVNAIALILIFDSTVIIVAIVLKLPRSYEGRLSMAARWVCCIFADYVVTFFWKLLF